VNSPSRPPVNLFIAFFPSQRSGDTLHSPRNCLPGSGWTPVESARLAVQLHNDSAILINRYVVAKGTDRVLVLYWYQAHGRVTASEYWAKVFLVADSLRLNRTDGALIRVVTSITQEGNVEIAQARALEFIQQILPLDSYIPR
jgi:EpsI family protein